MKKIVSIIAFAICLGCFTTNVDAQPTVDFYDKIDGQFKQDNGDLVFIIKKHNQSDDIGNSSQGIMVTTNTNPKPAYYARTIPNQPNKYVLPAMKSFYIEYLTNDKLSYNIPGVTLTFTRIKTNPQPPRVTFFDKIEGTFQQVGSEYKVNVKKENKSTGQGIRLTPNNGGKSAYYGRSTSNQPNRYNASNNKSVYIKYVSTDEFQYIAPNKTIRFTRVIEPPLVTFFDKIEGAFQQVGSEYKVNVKKEDKSLGQGIRVTPKNGGKSAYYGRSTSNQPNKYTASTNRSIYIKYVSNNEFQYIAPNKTIRFTRVKEEKEEVKPVALKIVPTITFKVDGNDNITKSINPKAKVTKNTFKISLKTNRQITWWKGIKIFDKSGKMVCLLSTQENDHGPTMSQVFRRNQFGAKVKVEFWKAKAFGVHTHVATKYFDLRDLLDTETNFHWMND